MKRNTILMVLLTVGVLFGACANRKAVTGSTKAILPFGEADLDGDWILSRAYSDGAPELTSADLKGMTVSFNRKEHRISGRAACNRYFGTYTATNTTIKIGSNIGSTRMMCDRLNTELAFLKSLPRVNSYRFLGHNEVELRHNNLCMYSLRRAVH